MSFALETVVRQAKLRIAIITANPVRKATLTGIVAGAGHCVISDVGAADIVISDETTAVPAHSSVIRLGETGDDIAAGVLSRNATTRQIVEAVRSGPGNMPHFGPGNISNAEVRDITAYVHSYIQHPINRGGFGLGGIGPVGEGFVGLLIGVGALMLVCFWIGDRT